MSDTTGIEWADATVNFVLGCTKVSTACKHCYAEKDRSVLFLGARVRGKGLPMWGANGYRYETAGWEAELRRLNRKAKVAREAHAAGERYRGIAWHPGQEMKRPARPRVFINSLSDTFDDFAGDVYRLADDKPVVVAQSLDDVRSRFFRVAEECTELDLLLLTKRPENAYRMVPADWTFTDFGGRGWPSGVWLGTTVEDQEHADKRIPELLKVPAKVRFLSCEPLLGEVDLERHLWQPWEPSHRPVRDKLGAEVPMTATGHIHWVIVGGESGHGARPMHPDWVRSIRDQCVAAGVPFFFKQWGEWRHVSTMANDWPQEWPQRTTMPVLEQYYRPGKKNAGRRLGWREWNEVPK